MSTHDEGIVYYREIQKNAYLKRIPNEPNGSKLLPLSHKKPPLKPMWTLLCIHNGRTPFLEQYPEATSSSTTAHRPVWRACLKSARHVTASVRPRGEREYDFLVDTDHGPVRMLAPDWESMQDWVHTLRAKLYELRIVGGGENVYCAPPTAPPAVTPRAAARDPTSPLPPTPPTPPHRVPGVEIAPPTRSVTQPESQTQEEQTQPQQEPDPEPTEPEPTLNPESIDISNWDPDFPSTSQENKMEPKKSVAKICGQNICLDDSILKRNIDTTDSDEEFFAEIDRLHGSVENIDLGENIDYKLTRVVVNDKERSGSKSPTNITVIQVCTKPAHTSIPVVGPDDSQTHSGSREYTRSVSVGGDCSSTQTNQSADFKQSLPITDDQSEFINIVNTESNDNYGTVFDNDYGHISLSTTVSLTPVSLTAVKDDVYERLCMASTSNERSPLPLRKLKAIDRVRKSSLPNLDSRSIESRSPLEESRSPRSSLETESRTPRSPLETESRSPRSPLETESRSPGPHQESPYEYLFPNNNSNKVTLTMEHHSLVEVNSNGYSDRVGNSLDTRLTSNSESDTRITRPNDNVQSVDCNTSVVRSNVERSHSQNAYDRSQRTDIRREKNGSPKRDIKSDKPENKPIWKRGLTELSLLSKLRARNKRTDNNDSSRSASSPVKVVRRSRPETRRDMTRRRSSSLSNGQPPPPTSPPNIQLTPLRSRQAASLRAELMRGAAIPTTVSARDQLLVVDYNGSVWISWWGPAACRINGRTGDRLVAVRGVTACDVTTANRLLHTHGPVDILFHRVPLAKVFVINKRNLENIGIKLDHECTITSVEPGSPAARAGLPLPGKWAVTEVNNRHINLIKGGEEEMNRLSAHGTEVLILVQPAALVKKLRHSMKAARPLLSLR